MAASASSISPVESNEDDGLIINVPKGKGACIYTVPRTVRIADLARVHGTTIRSIVSLNAPLQSMADVTDKVVVRAKSVIQLPAGFLCRFGACNCPTVALYAKMKQQRVPCDKAMIGLFTPQTCEYCEALCKSKPAYVDATCDKSRSSRPCGAFESSSSSSQETSGRIRDDLDTKDNHVSELLRPARIPEGGCLYNVDCPKRLSYIARKHKSSVSDLIELNPSVTETHRGHPMDATIGQLVLDVGTLVVLPPGPLCICNCPTGNMYTVQKVKSLPCDNALRGLFPPYVCDWCVDLCRSKTAWRDATCDKVQSAIPCREPVQGDCGAGTELARLGSASSAVMVQQVKSASSLSPSADSECIYKSTKTTTFGAIAASHGVEPGIILRLNGISNPSAVAASVPIPVSSVFSQSETFQTP